MSSETTLSEFAAAEERAQPGETPGVEHDAVSRPQWAAAAIECDCGEDITQWHTVVEARRLRRQYARDDGTVPACPDCVEMGAGNDDPVGVAKAIVHAETEASTTPMDADRRLEVITREVER